MNRVSQNLEVSVLEVFPLTYNETQTRHGIKIQF